MKQHTRRLYAFDKRFEFTPRLTREHSIEWLRAVAAWIWGNEGRAESVPKIVAGDSSHCIGNGRIELARHQRCIAVLIHELAHAMGTEREHVHGPTFCRRYFRLLASYGGENINDIESMAKVVGIKL